MLVTGGVAVLLLLLWSALGLISVATAAHRAGSAADLAALGAASTAAQGAPTRACSRAARLLRGSDVRLVGCAVTGGGAAEVRVRVPVRVGLPGLPDEVAGRARAGPQP